MNPSERQATPAPWRAAESDQPVQPQVGVRGATDAALGIVRGVLCGLFVWVVLFAVVLLAT